MLHRTEGVAVKLFLNVIVAVVVMALLAACGGGGSTFELFPDANNTPVANAGSNQIVVAGTSVTLDGSASRDKDGDTLVYSWSISSKPSGSTAALSSATVVNPTFTADLAGDYLLTLVVSDGKTTSSAATVTVTATTATSNTAPVANAGTNQTVVAGTVVTLNGSGTDINGDTLSYSWTFTSKPDGSGAALSSTTVPKPTFTADVAGAYVLSLIVNDGKVNSAASATTITATTATVNVAPVANAGANQTVVAGTVVTLNGSGTDANGDPLTYTWTTNSIPNVDGPSNAVLSDPSAAKPTFTADLAGAYVFSLRVNDGKLDSEPATVTVTASNTPPVASAGPDQTNVYTGNLVTLDGSGSNDANGDPLRYSWAFTSKPAGAGSVALTGSATVSPTFTPTVTGSYTLQLTVSDRYVNSTDTVTITASNLGSITVTW